MALRWRNGSLGCCPKSGQGETTRERENREREEDIVGEDLGSKEAANGGCNGGLRWRNGGSLAVQNRGREERERERWRLRK